MAAAFGRLPYGKSVLSQHFLPQLRLLIRSKTEPVRHEGVLLLGETVTHCASLTASLGSLRQPRKADAELDFCGNSRHIQTHRRSRALLRFIQLLTLKDLCEQSLIGKLNVQTVVHHLVMAHVSSAPQLFEASLKCLELNKSEVRTRPEWNRLNANHPHLFVLATHRMIGSPSM